MKTVTSSSVTQTGSHDQPDTLDKTARHLADAREGYVLDQKRAAAAAGEYADVFATLRGDRPVRPIVNENPRVERLEQRVERLIDKIEKNHVPPSLRHEVQGEGFTVRMHQQRPWVVGPLEVGIDAAIYRTRRQVAALRIEAKHRAAPRAAVVEAPVIPPIGQRLLLAAPSVPPMLLLGPVAPTSAPVDAGKGCDSKPHGTRRPLIQALYAIIAQPCVSVMAKGPTILHIGTRYQYYQVAWSAKDVRIINPRGISSYYDPVPLRSLGRIVKACQRRFWTAEYRRFEHDLKTELIRLPGALYIERSGGKAVICTQSDERARVTAISLSGFTKLEEPVPAELYLRGHGPAWGTQYAFGFTHLDDIHDVVDRLVEAHNAAVGVAPVVEEAPAPRPVNAIAALGDALHLAHNLPLISPEYLVMEPGTRSAMVADLRTALTKLKAIRERLILQPSASRVAKHRAETMRAQPIRAGGSATTLAATVKVQQTVAAICTLAATSPEYVLVAAETRAALVKDIQRAESVLSMIQSQISRPAKVGMYARR